MLERLPAFQNLFGFWAWRVQTILTNPCVDDLRGTTMTGEGRVLDRALELAASGGCQSIQQIGAVLRREGFAPEDVKKELSGSSMRGRLKKLIAHARGADIHISATTGDPAPWT